MTFARPAHRILLEVLSIAVAIVGFCGSTEAHAADVVTQSVCELFEHPALYDGKSVRVRGTLTSHGPETAVIQDDSCPKVGLGLTFSDAEAKTAAARSLMEDLFPGLGARKPPKWVVATLTGTFSFRPTQGNLRLMVVDQNSDASTSKERIP